MKYKSYIRIQKKVGEHTIPQLATMDPCARPNPSWGGRMFGTFPRGARIGTLRNCGGRIK
jgi:hypothetical protein